MKKIKSLKFNMVLNAIKSIMEIIFPLITFPYASKVLGVDNIGKYNFCASIISYFVMLSELGTVTYAIREGAAMRTESNKLNNFVSQMFSMRVYFMILSCIFLFVLIAFNPTCFNNRVILYIMSLNIIFNTIGVDWIFSIFEDYSYITVISIILRIFSVILLFVFVRKPSDIIIYTVVGISSKVVGGIINFLKAKKYCKITFTLNVDWRKHFKPILILFGMNIAISIYVSLDTTMLGFLCDDYTVGIYTVSSKIYSIVKTLLSSILVVSIPRLSSLLKNDDKLIFSSTAEKIYKMLLTVLMPSIFGVFLLKRQIIFLISSKEFITATSSLSILCMALLFCMGSWFWAQCVLIPLRKEKDVLWITVVSAIVNLILNFILIPFGKENAAAFTTLISEGISFILCRFIAKKNLISFKIKSIMGKIIIGCLGIFVLYYFINKIITNDIAFVCVMISFSVIVYFALEIILKNEAIGEWTEIIKKKFNKC